MSPDSTPGPALWATVGTSDEARAAFAALVRHFEPYAREIVYIGGWVQALYLAEASSPERPVGTDDIDVTIPRRLLAQDRPALLQLAAEAGFDAYSYVHGDSIKLYRPGAGDARISVDLMTDAPSREIVAIDGQPDLLVDGYAGQRLLLENARWMEVGSAVHPSLSPSVRIRVPTLSAYVLQKGLASDGRKFFDKKAKDIVYIFQIIRHDALGPSAAAGMPALVTRYPQEWARWSTYIEALLTNQSLLRMIALQLIAAHGVRGTQDEVMATVVARLRRFISEVMALEP